MSLSVKCINFIFFRIVKGFVREVLWGGVLHRYNQFTCYIFGLIIINEAVMSGGALVIQVHVYEFFINKCAGDKWIREIIDWYIVVIQVQFLVNIKLFFINFLLCSRLISKCSELEISIINIGNSKEVTICILFYLLKFNVVIWMSSYLFFKCQLVISKTVLLNKVFFIILFCNSYCVLRVIGDHNRYYWPHCHHIHRLRQPREDVVKVFESFIWLHINVRVST